MVLRHASLIAASILFLLAPPAANGECPAGPERERIESSLATDYLAATEEFVGEPASVDHITFLEAPDSTSDCVAFVSLSDRGRCHACQSTLRLVELARTADEWKRVATYSDVVPGGPWGKTPVPQRIDLGGNRVIYQLSFGDMHFGQISRWVVWIAKLDGRYSEVLWFPSGGSNGGTGDDPVWEWTATVDVVQQAEQFPLLALTYRGTEEHDGLIRPIDRTELYYFSAKEYRFLDDLVERIDSLEDGSGRTWVLRLRHRARDDGFPSRYATSRRGLAEILSEWPLISARRLDAFSTNLEARLPPLPGLDLPLRPVIVDLIQGPVHRESESSVDNEKRTP